MRQIVVTGGGTGIGKAIAAAFAQDGNVVVITGRRPEPLAAAAAEIGHKVRAVPFDAADPAQVERALPGLPDTVDVLVNAAVPRIAGRQSHHRAAYPRKRRGIQPLKHARRTAPVNRLGGGRERLQPRKVGR